MQTAGRQTCFGHTVTVSLHTCAHPRPPARPSIIMKSDGAPPPHPLGNIAGGAALSLSLVFELVGGERVGGGRR